MEALYQKGINFDFTTAGKPNIKKLENTYGSKIASIIDKVEKVKVLESLEDSVVNRIIEKGNYSITINTHGDTLPFYHHSMSKNNAITYCHFPSAKYHIDSENLEYLRDIRATRLLQIPNIDFFSKNNVAVTNLLDPETKQKVKRYFKFLREKYESLMKNTLVLTNSQYTSRAITNSFNIHPKILYPPVDVETFRQAALNSTHRENMVLVISRIAPDKQIENAIEVARILKDREEGGREGRGDIATKAMIIAGNLHHYDSKYYQQLRKMIIDYGLSNYISLQTNISFSRLLQLMQLAKVYFHPRLDEHFGISIVEAMAAGLIPVVSKKGGHTEYTPSKYHFDTVEQAADIIALAFEEARTESERSAISDSTTRFSNTNYIKSFHAILSELLTK